MMFLVSFDILVFCRSLRENCDLKVEIAKMFKSYGRAIERIVPCLSAFALNPSKACSSAHLHRERIDEVSSMLECT
jgi:hypothetical protein